MRHPSPPHALPQDHRSADSKRVVTMSMGLVATMAALVLGLLVSSAKSFYDAQSTELTQISTKVILLDRLLANYGPETKDTRDLLRGDFANSIDRIWPRERTHPSKLAAPSTGAEALIVKIQSTIAEGRSATLDPSPGIEYRGRSLRNTLVDVRARSQLGFQSHACHLGLLAYRDFCKLRALRASQHNRYHRFIRSWVVSFWRDLLDLRDVFALWGTDPNF